jgi:hypothetical protein
MAVVEQPPRGGGDVTIRRTCYHTRVHLAILRICDMRTLDAADRDALTARYGYYLWTCRVLFVRYALCVQMISTIRAVLWFMYAQGCKR